MAFRLLLLCTLCPGGLGPSAAATQAPAAPNPPTASRDQNQVAQEIRVLDLIALDKDGRPVTNLKPDELRLFENKSELKIKSLSPAAREPFTIGLFFDVSGSRRDDTHVTDETRLTSEWVHSIWRRGDTVFLLGFADRTIVFSQPTQKLEAIDEGLQKIPSGARGSTALYDALCSVKPEQLAALPGRKVYVVFSDFGDNSSRNTAEYALELAREAGVAIFPVVLDEDFGGHSKKEEKLSRGRAQRIANGTGGEVLIPESRKQLPLIFQRLAADLQSTYRISYAPSSTASQNKSTQGRIRLETTREHLRLIYAKE